MHDPTHTQQLNALGCPTAPHWRVDWDTLLERFDWLRPMVGCPQDPTWHPEGDVWTHTTMVGQAMANTPEWRALEPTVRAELFTAALLHDLGKPDTTKHEPSGTISSIGHTRLGSHLARRQLWRLGVERAARERVCSLIQLHAVPYWAMQRRNIERDIMAMAHRIPPRFLALLARCDARGKGTDDTTTQHERIGLFSDLAAKLGCIDSPFLFPSAHARVEYFRTPGRDPHDAPHFEPACTVTLTCGLPATGKSRWVREHCAGQPVVSPDAPQQASKAAHKHLRAGRDFCWDATNLERSRRKVLVGLFMDHGAEVRIVHVEATEPTLRARNAARSVPVPDDELERMILRWEPPHPIEAHEILWVDG